MRGSAAFSEDVRIGEMISLLKCVSVRGCSDIGVFVPFAGVTALGGPVGVL